MIIDNNLLWRSKAYSFGHFVCDLSGDTPHVQHASCTLAQQRLLLVTAGNLDFYNRLVF